MGKDLVINFEEQATQANDLRERGRTEDQTLTVVRI